MADVTAAGTLPEGPTPGAVRMIRRTVHRAFVVFAVGQLVAVGVPLALLWRDDRADDRRECLDRVARLGELRTAFRIQHDALAEYVDTPEVRALTDYLNAAVLPALPAQDPDDCPGAP